MIKNQVTNYMLRNGSKLPKDMSWYKVGKMFGVEPADTERALKDKKYRKDSISKKACDIWRAYTKQVNKLEVVKQTYTDGELVSETYKPGREVLPKIDYEDYEIEKLTTNPNGIPWLKMKKKETFLNEEHIQDLKTLLESNIKPYKRLKTKIDDNPSALFIYGSDKHIGALTKENSIYTNKYDEDVMRYRIVEKTLDAILEYNENYGTIESLYIMELGDALDGFNGKTTGGLRGSSQHTLPQQYNNREQHDLYVKLHKELFDILMVEDYFKFNNLYFVATSNSNHGGDFEYGAMRNLETYLNVKYPQVKTFVSDRFLNHFIYGKHCIIFSHGKDDEDMRNGLPLTLNDKTEVYLNNYIDINKLHDYYITFVSGDLHQSAETHGKKFRYKKVLSQFGSSKWIHTNFGSGVAGLSVDLVSKDKNSIKSENIIFENESPSNTGIKF